MNKSNVVMNCVGTMSNGSHLISHTSTRHSLTFMLRVKHTFRHIDRIQGDLSEPQLVLRLGIDRQVTMICSEDGAQFDIAVQELAQISHASAVRILLCTSGLASLRVYKQIWGISSGMDIFDRVAHLIVALAGERPNHLKQFKAPGSLFSAGQ